MSVNAVSLGRAMGWGGQERRLGHSELTRWRSPLGSSVPTCCGTGAVPRCPRAEAEKDEKASQAAGGSSSLLPGAPLPGQRLPPAPGMLLQHPPTPRPRPSPHFDGDVPFGDFAHVEAHGGNHVLVELTGLQRGARRLRDPSPPIGRVTHQGPVWSPPPGPASSFLLGREEPTPSQEHSPTQAQV